MKFVKWVGIIALGAALLPGKAVAQDMPGTASGIRADASDPQGTKPDALAAKPASGAYTFPSGGQQAKYWARNIFGPVALAGYGASAAIDHGRNEPPEWGDGGKGFARRYGTAAGSNAISQTSLMLLSAAMRQDPIYYRCDCTGAGPRLGHAIKMSFMGRNRNGNKVFSFAKLASPWAGPMVSRSTWYPERYGPRDGATAGAIALGVNIGWNIAREFFLPAPKW